MRTAIDRLIETIGVVAMSLMVAACIWQVFTRYVLASPSGFTEEFMRFALIWTSMLGAPYAFGRGKHLAIVFGINQLTPERKIFVQYIVNICVLIFAVLVLIVGGIFVAHNAIGQVSAALGLPMEYFYLAAPISGILFLFYVYVVFKDLKLAKERLAGAEQTA